MNILFKPIIIIIFFIRVHGLPPNKNGLGMHKKYTSNTQKYLDLKQITTTQASTISKSWLINIMSFGNIHPEDEHVICKINELESYIQEHRTLDYRYCAWMPRCNFKTKEVIFIVILYDANNILHVKLLLQNPYWDSIQIDSLELKKTLLSLAEKENKKLNLDEIYATDFRYALEWLY
tara:strand:+ start:11136 stop:11669 length:534 start_codon:yes stop_codon:yes gene_type:complete